MKHIKLFEDFSTSKEIRGETSGTWSDIRDTVQSQKDFTIINFKNIGGYSRFIDDTSYDYIKQLYCSFWNGKEYVFPSIFIKRKLNIEKEEFKKYMILNTLVGTDGREDIKVTDKSGKTNVIANEIVDTLSIDQVEGQDYYKMGSILYKFINFLA